MAIFDGKGGMDWSWAERSASLFNNDVDLDLETATEQLETLAQRCVDDLKSHPWSESDPDFWHTGASALHPFHIVVIDECQTLFDVTGRSKEDKALVERCKRAVATIVRKGRSAGRRPEADGNPCSPSRWCRGSRRGRAYAVRPIRLPACHGSCESVGFEHARNRCVRVGRVGI